MENLGNTASDAAMTHGRKLTKDNDKHRENNSMVADITGNRSHPKKLNPKHNKIERTGNLTVICMCHEDNGKNVENVNDNKLNVNEDINKNSWKVWLKVVIKLLVCFFGGIVFGICLEKSRVFEPASIRGQFVFSKYIMLKVFLAAIVGGQIVLVVLSLLPPTKDRFNRTLDTYVDAFAEKGILTSLLGPFLVGIGMALSGACPGMVLAQVGTWTPYAILTFVGGLVAAFCYGLIAPLITKITKPKRPFMHQTVFQKLKLPYASLAIPMSLLLAAAIFCLEWFIPWSSELAVPNANNSDIVTARAWPPFASGLIIGLLQIIVFFVVNDTLGGSSAYVTTVSQWVATEKLQKLFPYLAEARCGLRNWWQVIYMFGAVLGGAISALASNTFMTVEGVHPAAAFCGGFLMLTGARFGAGCTSGHGLSGTALLVWLSFLAVPAMFAGGIGTAFAMQATGALTDYYTW